MSEENKSVDETVRDVEVEAGLKPVLDGVHSIARSLTDTEKRLSDKITDTDKTAKAKIEALEDKTNKSLESVLDRIDKLKDRSSVLGRALLDIQPGDDQVKSVISDDTKKLMPHFEHVCRSLPEKSHLKRPEFAAAAAEWFSLTGKAQVSKFAGRAGALNEQADRIYAALQDAKYGSNWEQKANPLQEGTDSEGGYLVPTIVEDEIQVLLTDAGDIFPRCRQIPMRSWKHNVPNVSTALSVGWAAEEGTLTGTEPVFGVVTLQAEKLYGRATLSIELLQDSSPGLLQFLLAEFTRKMAGELDRQVVVGDGTSPELLGIINGSGINAVTSGTAAGRALSLALLQETYMAGSEQTTRMDGVWICSPNGYLELLQLLDGNNRPYINDPVPNAPAGTLMGRPIIVSARLGGATDPSLDDSTNTNTSIVFGPLWAQMFGTRQGMMWDVTDQVGWANYRVDARLTGRFASRPVIPAAFSYLGQITTA